MTHDAWERGERLTIHNATKAQLKQMLEDEKSVTARLYSENQELKGAVDTLTVTKNRINRNYPISPLMVRAA